MDSRKELENIQIEMQDPAKYSGLPSFYTGLSQRLDANKDKLESLGWRYKISADYIGVIARIVNTHPTHIGVALNILNEVIYGIVDFAKDDVEDADKALEIVKDLLKIQQDIRRE